MIHFTGDSKKIVKHKEGDTWAEGNKTWTIKNGIKRTVNELEDTRKYFVAPLSCPRCNKSMNHHLSQTTWDTHRVCFECVIDIEHEIAKQGKWEEYVDKRRKANQIHFYKDLISYLEDFAKEDISKKHITEDGEIESWVGEDKKKVAGIVNMFVDKLKGEIKNDTDTH